MPTRSLPARRRRLLAFAMVPGLLGPMLATTPALGAGSPAEGAPASQARAASSDDKIRPLLEQRLADGTASFWVRFRSQADLSTARAIDDWAERGRAVVEELRRVADAAQHDVRAQLDDQGVDYDAFWATNAIRVTRGTEALVEQLAAEPEVAALHPTRTYEEPELDGEAQMQATSAVEWGVANINADDVWEQHGVTGQDVVVANIDSGVQFDHPALVNAYRGNNGDGTFTHDYSWFDSSATCTGAPCDRDGHGTHTMGTMVGDDGVGNQIGVAPGAKWIAANGCATCSDADLIESGQWLLAPTRVDGSDADPAMRPNIINNSWGSQLPSNDPFMQDVTEAWAAAGIFGVWSNGNIGPTCDTSSAPGSRIGNFSVGAYDSTNTIAGFSSRGAGQDGENKPNLSAPGVDVRSSIPGGRYLTADGTSMAAPHVAGTVALLWAAAPGLVGDVDATRALLDGSASDSPDSSCGGTDDDNNVYGEGRLDALALVDSAPVQDTGTLRLTTVDSRTGDPVNGARISLTGPVSRERVTRADGTVSVALPAGHYAVAVSAFGYADLSTSSTVSPDETTTLRLDLRATPRVRLTGRVTDGSGQGWPVYAKVTLDGVPGGTTYTDPADGRYSLSVPADAAYTLTATPEYAGYRSVTQDVVVGGSDTRSDVSAPALLEPCRTAGYRYDYDGVGTEFDHGLPAGWTVTDDNDSGTTWQFGDAFENGLGERIDNLSGGDGTFAFAQSPGLGVFIETTLTTPVADLSGVDQPVIGFRQHFTTVIEDAVVELSLDGGATWQTVLLQDRSARGPRETVVPIPQAAGQSQVQVRFHYGPARFNSVMWQLDDVYVGARSCEPVPGGLLVGHVRDANIGRAVNGAQVSTVGNADEVTRSMATPLDHELGDGFYSLFVSQPGRHRVAASAHEYATRDRLVRIEAGEAEDVTYSLAAGRLRVSPADLSEDVRVGRSGTETFRLTNTGSAPVRVRLTEQEGPPPAVGPGGSAGATGRVVKIEGDFSPLSFDGAQAGGATVPEAPASPWLELGDYPTRIMDNAVAEHRGKVYSVGGVDGARITEAAHVYDPANKEWSDIAPLPEEREAAAAGFIGGKLYVATGWPEQEWASTSTFVYDPDTDTWDTGADAPVGVAAAGRAVLDGRLYLVGGCTNACGENVVQRYDPSTDAWEQLADYPGRGRGHLACGALDGQLYCAGGIARTSTQVTNDTYAYDPVTDTWTQKADLPVSDLWGMGYTASHDRLLVSGGITNRTITNAGWVYDPQTDSWSSLPAARFVMFRGGSACGLFRIGGSVAPGFVAANSTEMLPTYGACAPQDVPWLSLDPRAVTIRPGDTVKVTLRLDADHLEPGSYDATAWIKEDTPYLVAPVGVRMNATRR
ncbi:MAG: S8 family serine peptidase [Nocardioides sp.]